MLVKRMDQVMAMESLWEERLREIRGEGGVGAYGHSRETEERTLDCSAMPKNWLAGQENLYCIKYSPCEHVNRRPMGVGLRLHTIALHQIHYGNSILRSQPRMLGFLGCVDERGGLFVDTRSTL
jgi:hypothetical protein